MGNKKINFVPYILLFVMIFSIGGSFLFNYLNKIYGTFYWAKFIFNFVACELIIFHITPPFATLITFIVVNTNKKYYDSFDSLSHPAEIGVVKNLQILVFQLLYWFPKRYNHNSSHFGKDKFAVEKPPKKL